MVKKPAKAPVAPATITLEELSALCGVTKPFLLQLEDRGYYSRIKKGVWPRDETIKGFIRYLREERTNETKSAAENRVRDARAREIEMRNAIRSKELCVTSEAIAAMQDVVGILRADLEGLAARVTRDLVTRRTIDSALHDIFNSASSRLRLQADSLSGSGEAHGLVEDTDAGSMGGDESKISEVVGDPGSA